MSGLFNRNKVWRLFFCQAARKSANSSPDELSIVVRFPSYESVVLPRYPRILLSGIPVHIVQRGHDRNPTFIGPSDFHYYLENVQEAGVNFEIDVHAYCLVTNHVHLHISPGQNATDVSMFMRLLAARQTRRVNRLKNRSETL